MSVVRNAVGLSIAAVPLLAASILAAPAEPAASPPAGPSRLVSVQHFPSASGGMCTWEPSPADLATAVEEADFGAALRKGRPGAFLKAALQPESLFTALRLGNQFEVYGPNRVMLTHSREPRLVLINAKRKAMS